MYIIGVTINIIFVMKIYIEYYIYIYRSKRVLNVSKLYLVHSYHICKPYILKDIDPSEDRFCI